MGTADWPFDSLMSRLRADAGVDAGRPPVIGPGDLSRLGVEAMVARQQDPREMRSHGQLRLSGPGVTANAINLDGVGNLATVWQRCVTAIGAALTGTQTALGRFSADIVRRTQLVLEATPTPGSLILNLSPGAPPADEAFPGGSRSLFEDDPRPLADLASTTLLTLLQSAATPQLDQLDSLSARFRELGPRVATNVRLLSDAVTKSHVDVYADWREPGSPTVRATFTAASAGWLRDFVAGRDLDAEDIYINGVVRTVSDISKWSIQSSEELLQIDARDLPESVIRETNVGDEIELVVSMRLTERPDGTTRRVIVAKDVAYPDIEPNVVVESWMFPDASDIDPRS